MAWLVFIALWWTEYIPPENWPSSNQYNCYNHLLNNDYVNMCGNISPKSPDVTFKCMYAVQQTCTFVMSNER